MSFLTPEYKRIEERFYYRRFDSIETFDLTKDQAMELLKECESNITKHQEQINHWNEIRKKILNSYGGNKKGLLHLKGDR